MSEFLFERLRADGDRLALTDAEGACTCRELVERFDAWRGKLQANGVAPGTVVSAEGDYDRHSISLFLALLVNRSIIVPLARDSQAHHAKFLKLGQVGRRIQTGVGTFVTTDQAGQHPLYDQLRAANSPGLVLFSSGSTGEPKAAVQDLGKLLVKFQASRAGFRTLVFLQFDHIGGVNTLLHALAHGGSIIVPGDRSAAAVCQAIERWRVELLPASPTFLNLLLLSGQHRLHDLSSLKLITYGTEPMPESTLARLVDEFPNVKIQQTYGLTEVGILRSQSRDSRSLWLRVGGEGYETKVVDGRLWIRAQTAMLGYLNAPSPFDADGFLDTGDAVEVDGEWLRILGRATEIINVGGAKVYPAEVENVLLQMDNVVDAAVRGEPNPISGQMVVASVVLQADESPADFKARMRLFCKSQLQPYMIPAKVRFVQEPLHSARFKKTRRASE